MSRALMATRSNGRKLFIHDRKFGSRFVAGADEVGRGCPAGPLVAAAVLFDLDRVTPRDVRALGRLNDSKQLSEDERALLYPVVMRVACKVSVVSRCSRGIDARGLHRTNLNALREALCRVARPGAQHLSDGFALGKDLPFTVKPIVDGEIGRASCRERV